MKGERERDRIIKKGTGRDRRTDICPSQNKLNEPEFGNTQVAIGMTHSLSLSPLSYLSLSFTHTHTPAHTHYTVVYGAHNTSTLKMYFNVSPALPFRLPVVIFNVFHLLQRRMMGGRDKRPLYTHTHKPTPYTYTRRPPAATAK